MVIGGGVLLGLSSTLGLHGIFATMAVLTVLASAPVLATREPHVPLEPAGAHNVHFLWRPGAWRLIALVVVYKSGEAFAQGMLRPFLKDLGLGLDDIGWLVGTVGFAAGMGGAIVGGILVGRLGRLRSLVWFGFGQVITVAGYAYLAFTEPSRVELAVWLGVEYFASGMATASLFTSMMDWSRPETAGTDYTVQASAVVIATGVATGISGFSAQALGYGPHFVIAAVLCVIAVVVVARLYPRAG
jgi:predicted MFS family arabinose efflux permease